MKTINFIYAPGNDLQTSAGGGDDKKKPVKVRLMPRSDADFKDVSEAAADTWLANPDIILRYTKAPDFKLLVTSYSSSLVSRINTGSLRPGQTAFLNQLDEKIETGVGKVKTYLEKKYEDGDPQAQYARFGIIKEGRKYIMSRDRNNRRMALQQMIDGIAAEGFGSEKFGTIYWRDIQTAYNTAFTDASTTTGSVSGKVADKNKLKEDITTVLVSLLKVLEGNYPNEDEYKGIIRQWGWKKESY